MQLCNRQSQFVVIIITIDLSLTDVKAAKDPGSSSHGCLLFIALHQMKYSWSWQKYSNLSARKWKIRQASQITMMKNSTLVFLKTLARVFVWE